MVWWTLSLEFVATLELTLSLSLSRVEFGIPIHGLVEALTVTLT